MNPVTTRTTMHEIYLDWVKSLKAMRKCTETDASFLPALVIMESTHGSSYVPPGVEEFPLYLIAQKRAQAIGINLSPCALTLVAMLARNPGDVVIYIHYLRGLQIVQDFPHAEVVTLQDLCRYVFPLGSFSPEQLDIAWDAQKIRTDHSNLLDREDALEEAP